MLDNGNLYTYDEWKVHEKYTVNNSDKKMQPRKKSNQELHMLQSRIKAENVLLDITITASPLTVKKKDFNKDKNINMSTAEPRCMT